MFPELEQAYQNSVQAGLVPEGSRKKQGLFPLNFFKRRIHAPRLDGQLSRYTLSAFLANLLSDHEIRIYNQNIPQVIAQERLLQQAYPYRPKPPGWDMTEPSQHDRSNFRLLVHSLYYEKDYVVQLRNGDKSGIDRFLRARAISCSIIDEIHRGTIGDADNNSFHGFILNVSHENILAISFSDMGKPTYLHYSQSVTTEEVEGELAAEIELKKNTAGATAFMRRADSTYNEVVINGSNDVRIGGIFLLSDPFLNLPIYEIYSRIGRKGLAELKRLKTIGCGLESESDLSLWTGGGTDLSVELWQARYYMKRYSEAKDLAYLLTVPIVLIPQQVLPYYPPKRYG